MTRSLRRLGSVAQRVLPPTAYRGLKSGWRSLARLGNLGTRCECPLCRGHFRTFVSGGVVSRPRAACPDCQSLKRHRLAWLFLAHETNLTDDRPKRLLHFAPERHLATRFRQLPQIDYVSADLEPGRAMLALDITDTRLPSASFDVIYCSHVLEHVEDDQRAMTEMSRILRPGGWAFLSVPIHGPRTIEDPAMTSPEERLRVFGQEDHVRIYGDDGTFVQRLKLAGFDVRAEAYGATLTPAEQARFGIDPAEYLFYCTKPTAMSNLSTTTNDALREAAR